MAVHFFKMNSNIGVASTLAAIRRKRVAQHINNLAVVVILIRPVLLAGHVVDALMPAGILSIPILPGSFRRRFKFSFPPVRRYPLSESFGYHENPTRQEKDPVQTSLPSNVDLKRCQFKIDLPGQSGPVRMLHWASDLPRQGTPAKESL